MRLSALAFGVLVLGTAHAGTGAPRNLAQGRSYVLSPPPNYPLCTDSGDAEQLTDGNLSANPDYFWKQKSTVGWYDLRTVGVTVDLGSSQPLGGVAFHTGAGAADVEWPEAVFVFVGEQPDQQHYVADIAQTAPPRSPGYSTFSYSMHGLQARGRYVTFMPVAANRRFIFVDEIEVFAPEPSAQAKLKETPPARIGKPVDLIRQLWAEHGMARRIHDDIASLRAVAAAATLRDQRQTIDGELDALAAEATSSVLVVPQGRLTLPLPGIHVRLFAIRAHLLRAIGQPALIVSESTPWTAPAYLQVPQAPQLAALRTSEMRGNESRSMTFTLTNSTADTTDVQLSINGFGPNQPHVELRHALWTDTLDGKPAASALEALSSTGGIATVRIPSGVTEDIWLTVRAGTSSPGDFRGQLSITTKATKKTVPITVHVAPIEFPTATSLYAGGFDYVNEDHFFDLTTTNRDSLTRILTEYGLDEAWGTRAVLPQADEGTSSSKAAFERWFVRRPHAAHRYVFLALPRQVDRIDDLKKQVPTWANWVRAHGLNPASFSLLLIDEPSNIATDHSVSQWARAVHEANAGFEVWEDPLNGGLSSRQELLNSIDVFCQLVEKIPASGTSDAKILEAWAARPGHALELYSTRGQAPSRDAYADYRLLPWLAWRLRARAIHYWSMIDAGGASSWRAYEATRDQYSPLFVDASSITVTRQLEALREGLEDHAYLRLLDRAISAARPSDPARASGQHLLAQVNDVVAHHGDAERLRLDILDLLTKLDGK